MIIITKCSEHGLRVWKDVRAFDSFKINLESLNNCILKYYLLEDGEVPENFDSFNVDGNKINFIEKQSTLYQSTSLVAWYSMSQSEREEVYTASELSDISTALANSDFLKIETGKLPKPSSYPVIPRKNITRDKYHYESVNIGSITVRCLNE